MSTFQKRLFAWGMAKASDADATKIKIDRHSEYTNLGELKQAVLGDLQGKILEIGPGAGANLAYYPQDIHWIGIEPNPFMFAYLEREAENRGIKTVEIHQGVAENLRIENYSQVSPSPRWGSRAWWVHGVSLNLRLARSL
jgi:SAM-dependent methyltransferase